MKLESFGRDKALQKLDSRHGPRHDRDLNVPVRDSKGVRVPAQCKRNLQQDRLLHETAQ
jgi:hypothetical protein